MTSVNRSQCGAAIHEFEDLVARRDRAYCLDYPAVAPTKNSLP